MKKNNKGISLIELVGTIGIIVALFALIIPAISTIKNKRKELSTSAEIVQLDTALMAFFTDNGYYPRPGLPEMVASLCNGYFDFDKDRLEGNTYKDPWEKPYLYISPGVISSKGYDLYSVGLLMSTGKVEQLTRIMSAVSSLNNTGVDEDEVKIGQPTGQDGKTIWGLTEPEYDILIKAALSLLRYTDEGYELAVMINITNLKVEFADLSETGYLAYYWPYSSCEDRGIYLDISLMDGPAEAIAAIIAHEATHLADHLSSGDTYYDSIEEEYDAYYNEAMVWKEITEGKTFTSINETYDNNVETQEENLVMVMKGEKAAKEELKQRYPWAPEEDQWGDSHVVAKEY